MAGKLRTIGHKLRPSMRRGPVIVREKQADPFYTSSAWKALMREIIKTRGRRCEDPEHHLLSSSVAAKHPDPSRMIYGDHVIEIRDGGAPLDPSNVLLRCASCHGRKTAEARAARARG